MSYCSDVCRRFMARPGCEKNHEAWENAKRMFPGNPVRQLAIMESVCDRCQEKVPYE